MSTPVKSAASFITIPGLILLIIAVVLLYDWNVNGGFGSVSRIVAYAGGALFVLSLVVAVIRGNKQ